MDQKQKNAFYLDFINSISTNKIITRYGGPIWKQVLSLKMTRLPESNNDNTNLLFMNSHSPAYSLQLDTFCDQVIFNPSQVDKVQTSGSENCFNSKDMLHQPKADWIIPSI